MSTPMAKTNAMKMCRGWTTEVHWQSGDSPKWFYCKRLTDEHTSYFPRTQRTIRRDDTDVGIRPRSGAGVPWGAESREWIRFGKRRGRPLVDGGDAGAPIHNEFLCHSSGLVGCPGYGRGTNAPPATWDLEAKTNDTPELLLQLPFAPQQINLWQEKQMRAPPHDIMKLKVFVGMLTKDDGGGSEQTLLFSDERGQENVDNCWQGGRSIGPLEIGWHYMWTDTQLLSFDWSISFHAKDLRKTLIFELIASVDLILRLTDVWPVQRNQIM